MRERVSRRVLRSILPILLLIIIGTAGYHLIERMEFIDSLFMTVITISTVGFGEVKPLSHVGRIFTMGLIVGGVGIMAYTLGNLAEYIFSGEMRLHLEHGNRLKMLKQLNNHIIICGYGRVGRHVVHELLAEKLPFVVIDTDAAKIIKLHEEHLPALEGNASEESVLRAAAIDRARGMVVAANSDAENVFIVLTARSLREDISIVARANQEESEKKLLRAGATRVILPYVTAGRKMVTSLVRPDVAEFLDEVSRATGMELLIEQIHLSEKSGLVGKTLKEVKLSNRLGITILACKFSDGKFDTKPNADTMITANCELIALGTRDQLEKLFELARNS